MKEKKPRAQEADLDFEIRFYEGVLSKRDDFLEALMALGDAYTKKGLYEQGLKIDQKLASLRPEDGVVFYNLACSYSLLNRLEEAFAAIKSAIEKGYDNIDYLFQDKDLTNLLKDQRFINYLLALKDAKAANRP